MLKTRHNLRMEVVRQELSWNTLLIIQTRP
jgi:hypothetical protein